jgi:hypothetical protein
MLTCKSLKIFTVTTTILCAPTFVIAQVLIALVFGEKLQSEKLTFGLCLAPTSSNISNVGGHSDYGFGLGLYFDIKMSENFFLHPEIWPKSHLASTDLSPYPTGIDSVDSFFSGGSVTRKLRAMSFPLLCRYRIKGLLFAEAGPQINWMLRAKDTFETKVNGEEVTYETDLEDQYTRFDFAVAAGLHYKLKKDKGMGIGIRYAYGLTDIDKLSAGTQVNKSLYLTVLVPVGAGKSNADQSTK